MSHTLYDVVIVGAGPGGSATAISLARAGWKVLLIDKANFPRDKVCGDMISPRSQRVLRALGCSPALEAACPNRVTSGAFYLHGERIMAAKVPQVMGLTDYGYVLPRTLFDEIIFRQAQTAGAETIEQCEVKGVDVGRDGATVRAECEGKPCTFHARLVIGADGARSVVARAVGLGVQSAKSGSIALRAYYEGVAGDPSRVDISFDKSFFPGYAWIFPLGDGRANVGLGMVTDVCQRYKINLRERLTNWIETDPTAQVRLRGAHLEGRIVGWPLNTYCSASRSYARRVLLVGDAAGLVDPLNGEGIHTALESAHIAAEVAGEALRANDLSAAFLSRYERRWRSAFDLDLRIADLYVTVAKNRSFTSLWLSVMRLMGDTARRDREYARTITGILAGVVPTRKSLSVRFILKTLVHDPRLYARIVVLSFDWGQSSLSNWNLAASKDAVEWGKAVFSKMLGVLTHMRMHRR